MDTILTQIKNDPLILTKTYPEVKKLLHKQGNLSLEKGIGNKPQDQEVCFAELLLEQKFEFIPKGQTPTENSFMYQPNGTQRCPDFIVFIKGKQYQFDLKFTKGKTFYWNDGWWKENILYIITYAIKKQTKVYIGLGQNSYDKGDDEAWTAIRETIKQMNSIKKKTKFLKIYNRLANQYSCDQFTPEFVEQNFKLVLDFLR
jgi:hypothetical protein